MVLTQYRSRLKSTGGRYTSYRKKRKAEIGRAPTNTKIGERKLQMIRTKGGDVKPRLAFTSIANVTDPATKKAMKATIKTVVENPANWQLVRRNIITQGSIIETDKGRARVTSRPGQDGVINAVLVK
ncbi:30S ribosomal protein S8e [Candidatus Woesearchaeota archaeon]|nr:30S ribosomal protein S8e [Candidatus Woesearchaeota archaeon]